MINGLGNNKCWHLVNAAYNGKPEALMSVLNQFTAADFTAMAQDGPAKGKSALWWLACAALFNRPEALMAVINRFKNQLTSADFTTCAQDGPYNGINALWWLARAASGGNTKPLMSVLAHVTFDVQALTNLSKEPLPNEAQNLVTARINLATLLANSSTNEQTLFSSAEAAMLAGYVHAYYDLGKYFDKMHMLDQDVHSFLQMPVESNYVDNICNQYSACFIGMATGNTLEKLSHLKTALRFALKISHDENRHATLQTIARIYINATLKNDVDIGNQIIPQNLLEVMHGALDPDWCFKEFERLAENVKLKQLLKKRDETITVLTEKLKRSKRKRDLEQDNLQEVLIPIRELLSHFENEMQRPAKKAKVGNEIETTEMQVECQKQLRLD